MYQVLRNLSLSLLLSLFGLLCHFSPSFHILLADLHAPSLYKWPRFFRMIRLMRPYWSHPFFRAYFSKPFFRLAGVFGLRMDANTAFLLILRFPIASPPFLPLHFRGLQVGPRYRLYHPHGLFHFLDLDLGLGSTGMEVTPPSNVVGALVVSSSGCISALPHRHFFGGSESNSSPQFEHFHFTFTPRQHHFLVDKKGYV